MNNCNFIYHLIQTTYPDNPEMNVKYEYGAPNSGNETVRLIYQEDTDGIKKSLVSSISKCNF